MRAADMTPGRSVGWLAVAGHELSIVVLLVGGVAVKLRDDDPGARASGGGAG
jgi:hypothetical protein